MSPLLYIVDAFTDKMFGGNPAAVVLLEQPGDSAWMQSVAMEMNLSETAFVDAEPAATTGVRRLRWFTPTSEVDLCGHATLAAAHVLGDDQRFTTKSGELRCAVGIDGSIEMDFPSDQPSIVTVSDPHLAPGLPGAAFQAVARGTSDILVQLTSADEVRSVDPDHRMLAKVAARGVIVTAPGDAAGVDFVSRCFYPAVGVPEDPVTGSAHCTLACWWARLLGRSELVGVQLSRRGGVVRVGVNGDRVRLSGRAVTVMAGRLLRADQPQ